MKEAKTLLDIIRGSQETGSPLIIHTDDAWALVTEVKEATGVMVQYKNVPDDYQTERGYIWQRINKRKFQLTV